MHAFVVPAFGESPWLDGCLASIAAQTHGASEVLVTTSTPNAAMLDTARRHRVPVRVNDRRGGIGSDWNYALAATGAPWVTLAHQDDCYDPTYVARLLEALQREPDALMGFCDFSEVTALGPRAMHVNLRVKRWLCDRAFRGRTAIREPDDKRRLLAFGNPIGCPAVVLNRARVPGFAFAEDLASNLDWDAWLRLAELPGAFVRVAEPLVVRRIHRASETSALIADRRRASEDRAMFARLWPMPVASAIAFLYRLSYAANRTGER
jgi:hypothetical protein